jgi:hypothetical protein
LVRQQGGTTHTSIDDHAVGNSEAFDVLRGFVDAALAMWAEEPGVRSGKPRTR